MCPIPKSQMNVTSFHKGHYNTRETDDSHITDITYKKYSDANSMSMNSSSLQKSAIPKSILSQNKRISTGHFMVILDFYYVFWGGPSMSFWSLSWLAMLSWTFDIYVG